MVRISDIIFCLNATNMPGQGVSAHTVISAITPEYIPGLFSFSVIISLLGIDLSKNHTAKISFSGHEEDLVVLDGPIPPMEDATNLPIDYRGLNVSINLNNINFKTEGEYALRVEVDGNVVGEKHIYAKGKNQP